eukprot:2244639-Pleurochrysis_carterae.AAC.3
MPRMLPAGAVVYSSEKAVQADKDEKRPWREAFEKAKEAAATEAEMLADDKSLSVIRQRYGESSEGLIVMLLTFDALFEFRKVMRHRFDSACISEREEHALRFAQKHRTFWEQFERVTVARHKSQYALTLCSTRPSSRCLRLETSDISLWER